jgi:hypothetical protein
MVDEGFTSSLLDDVLRIVLTGGPEKTGRT